MLTIYSPLAPVLCRPQRVSTKIYNCGLVHKLKQIIKYIFDQKLNIKHISVLQTIILDLFSRILSCVLAKNSKKSFVYDVSSRVSDILPRITVALLAWVPRNPSSFEQWVPELINFSQLNIYWPKHCVSVICNSVLLEYDTDLFQLLIAGREE